jgi:hypothetical protein
MPPPADAIVTLVATMVLNLASDTRAAPFLRAKPRCKKRDERRNATPADAIVTLLATSVLKWDSTRRAAHSCALSHLSY